MSAGGSDQENRLKAAQDLQPRQKLLGFAVVAGVAFFIGMVGWAWQPASRQPQRLARAVPGFACEELYIETHSTSRSWSGDYEDASSVLRMPPDCRERLEMMVATGSFTERWCGIGRYCWYRRNGDEQFRIEFSRDSVSFYYSSS